MSEELPPIGGRFEKEAQIKQKNVNITVLIFLIILLGCFFYVQNWGRPDIYGHFALAKEKNMADRLNSAEEVKKSFQDYREGKNMLPYARVQDSEKNKPSDFEIELANLVEGYPIEEMVPTISGYDRPVAAMVVGIAKKESDWGNHSPSHQGADCFNYWGYKGNGKLGQAMGYACFASPEEGARVISERIKSLIEKNNIQRPSEMISWKCGSSCAGHSPESVNKWISDVSRWFFQVVNLPA